jgi:hypothetical protein
MGMLRYLAEREDEDDEDGGSSLLIIDARRARAGDWNMTVRSVVEVGAIEIEDTI